MKRCSWVTNNSLYIKYHDKEFGQAIRDERSHFENLCLELCQSGLSFEIILNKREAYRKLFDNFDVNKISKYNEKKYQELLHDKRIIRNKSKILAIINNAKVFVLIQKEHKSFNKYIWSFVDNQPLLVSKNKEKSQSIANLITTKLKNYGMIYIGATTIYSYLEASGIFFNHAEQCCKTYYLYIIRTNKNHLYTGITNDLERRFNEHELQGSKCAKYLRGKAPLKLVYSEEVGSKSMAQKREAEVKKMKKDAKEKLINSVVAP